MTIAKAIELITLHFKGHTAKEDPDFFNACVLGIEAMYRCQEFRKYTTPKVYMPLPGETKET